MSRTRVRSAGLLAATAVVLLSSSGTAQSPPSGRINPLIARLEAGGVAVTPTDWMFIDMEHGPYLLDRLQTTLADLGKKKKADGMFETAPIVRIPLEGDEDFRFAVKQVLDDGAFGVVLPDVKTKEEVMRFVSAMRYPQQPGSKYPRPEGVRGWGPTGARRMIDPLPADRLCVAPDVRGSPVSSNLSSASRTVFPMSKHLPLLL